MKPMAPNRRKRRGTMGVRTPAVRAEAARVPSRAAAISSSLRRVAIPRGVEPMRRLHDRGARVPSASASIKVPDDSFTEALRTREWTPLEPAVIDIKFYVRSVGEVKEGKVKGPIEELSPVSVKRP